MKSIKAGFCLLPVSWNSPSTVLIVDIMKQKLTSGAAAIFTPASAPANCLGNCSPSNFPTGWTNSKPCNSQPSTFNLIESGAHDGTLARDILNWLQLHRPGLLRDLEYIIIEPSARRREWQRETLKSFANVRWAANFQSIDSSTPHSALRTPHLNGVIFSNELLDAFPVRRFGWDAKEKEWFEWGVALDGDKFVWARIRNPQSTICNPQLEAVLPDGYIVETSPAAEEWWREAAGVLERGWLMTLDYGLTADEVIFARAPARHAARLFPASRQRRFARQSRRTGHHRPRQFFRNSKSRRGLRD